MGVTEYDWDSYNGYYSVSHANLLQKSLFILVCALSPNCLHTDKKCILTFVIYGYLLNNPIQAAVNYRFLIS